MADSIAKPCRACGKGGLELKPVRGPFSWKSITIVLSTPVTLLACNKCGEHVFCQGDAKMLDDAVEQDLYKLLGLKK